MTSEQLDLLATKVMGWNKHINEWLDYNGKVICNYKDWQPHKDLNHTLVLLWKKEGEIRITPQTSGNLFVQLIFAWDDHVEFFCEYDELASEICKAIYERIDIR